MLSASLVCMQIVKQKQRFQRAVVSREEALAMFQENKFKVEIITGLPEDATISLYRCARRPQSLRIAFHPGWPSVWCLLRQPAAWALN